jgi:uncharacterized membrane protein YphA (DoxX/SURF4 family)
MVAEPSHKPAKDSAMKSFAAKSLYTAVRVILGLLFIYAGTLKLMHPEGFAVTINIYGLVSWRMAGFLSYAIPMVEILSGLGLVLDVRGALAIIVAQLLGFMVVLLYALYLGLDADCGCFGNPKNTDNAPSGPLHAFVRDAVMLAGCALLYYLRRIACFRPRRIGRLFGRSE